MATTLYAEQSTGFKAGWWILMVVSALSLLNHFALIFFIPGEEVLFWGWAALNAYSTAVLLFAYRRVEKWAWVLTWVMVVPYALIFMYDAAIGPYYAGAAALMVVGQLLARGAFFAGGE